MRVAAQRAVRRLRSREFRRGAFADAPAIHEQRERAAALDRGNVMPLARRQSRARRRMSASGLEAREDLAAIHDQPERIIHAGYPAAENLTDPFALRLAQFHSHRDREILLGP